MKKSSFKYAFLALMPISLFGQNATWQATSSDDLELGTNWSSSSVPTGVATFDSTLPSVNLGPQLLPSATQSLTLNNFNFNNSASAFTYTINGPYALNFVGTNSGIIGTNTNTTINATNSNAAMTVPQLYFSGTSSTIGDAQLSATQLIAITNGPSTTDLSQIVFDGSGDSASHASSIVINSNTASLTAETDQTFVSQTTAVNNVSQIVFDGSGGIAGSTGSSHVTIEGSVPLSATSSNNDLYNFYQSNNVVQVLFDGSGGFTGGNGDSSVTVGGEANITANMSGGEIFSQGIGNNVAQIAFDGSGGVSYTSGGTGSSTVVIQGSAQLNGLGINYPYIGEANSGYTNDTAQILFSGNGGVGYGGSGTGSSTVTITDSAQLHATNNYYVAGLGTANDVGQIVFDGSGGTGSNHAGTGSINVTINGEAALTAENLVSDGYIYTASGDLNDLAQILFDGSPGANHAGGGQGSCIVSIGQNAVLTATNSSEIFTGGNIGNGVAQIFFDGSGGAGLMPNGTGSMVATISGSASLVAINDAASSVHSGTPYNSDVAQILFDGAPGNYYSEGSAGFCTVTIAENSSLSATNAGTVSSSSSYSASIGQIVFDGSGGLGGTGGFATRNGVDVLISDNTLLTATNASTGVLQGGASNDCAQILFSGSGGLQYYHAQNGSADVTLQGAAQLLATNAGVVSSSSVENDLGQIVFDGSGGVGYSSGSGHQVLTIDGTVQLQATNSGSISGNSTNDVGQIVFDGSGGYNSVGNGTGYLNAFITTSTPINAVNESGGTLGNSGSNNKVGQIIFDGSKGYNSSGTGSGELVVTFNDNASVAATNSGTIQSTGGSLGVGQILLDGRGGSSAVTLNPGSSLTAVNTSTGVVVGDQIAFYDTIVTGSGVAQATNQGGSVTHGVAFYGTTTNAPNMPVNLTGTSLWADSTLSPQFTMGPLTGDASSTAVLNQYITINTAGSALFAGNISGASGLNIIGTGQQILSGVNSYTGLTTVNEGTLTLQNSNISGSLLVNTGGSFSGVGTIAGPATVYGTLRPGFSPGTLTFLSGLTLEPSATTVIEVNATTASLLAVSGGNTNLAGTLHVIEDRGIKLGKEYVIVTETGGDLLGTFQRITNTGNLIPTVVYDPAEVLLYFQNRPVSSALLLFSPDRILRNIETLKDIDHRWDRVYCSCEQNPYRFYLEPTGSFGRVRDRSQVFGNKFQSAGFRVGGDYFTLGDESFGIGAIAEYNHWWSQLNYHNGNSNSDVAYGSIYLTYLPQTLQGVTLNLIGGGGYSWNHFERLPTEVSSVRARANPGGALGDVLVDVEYVWERGGYVLTPIAALQYNYAGIRAYSERGAGIYNQQVDRQDADALSTIVGARLGSGYLNLCGMSINPEVSVYWQHQFLDPSVHSRSSALLASTSPQTLLNVPGFTRDSLIVGADVGFILGNGTEIDVNYDLWYNKDAFINFFLVEWKVGF